MTFLRQVWSVMYKDLLVELRTPSRLSGLFFFALALLIMVAFSTGSSSRILQQIAGGTLWLGLLLASTRSLDQSFVLELEHGALEGLVLWPVSPAALYYGKAIANTFILLAVLLALCPLTIAMFNVHLPGNYGLFAGFLLLEAVHWRRPEPCTQRSRHGPEARVCCCPCSSSPLSCLP